MRVGILRRASDLLLESDEAEGEMVFYGGEPLLEFGRMREAARHVLANAPRGKVIRFALSTNGMLLDDRIAEFLAEHGVRTQISFDGVPAAQRLRGGGTFARLDRLLDRLARRLPRFFEDDIAIGMTPMVRALPYLARSVRYFVDKGVATIHMAPPFREDPKWSPAVEPVLEEQFARIREICEDRLRREGNVPVPLLRRTRAVEARALGRAPVCDGATGERIAVDVDGRVYGCAVLAESYQTIPSGALGERLRAMRVGGLLDRSFRRHLDGLPSAARAAGMFHAKERKHSYRGRCGDCRFVASCRICPVGSLLIPGNSDPHRLPDYSCAFNFAALRERQRMPFLPDEHDLLRGRFPVPEKVREFEEFLSDAYGDRPTAGVTRATSAPASRTPTSACRR